MAKKEDNQSLFQKLTKLFRSGPVVRRKIRNLDTAVAVPDKTKSSGALLFQKSMAPTYATITANAYNLSERLMRYQDFCFGKETLVYTLEGAFSIEDLAKKYSNGEQFFVYSYDYEKKKPVIGKAFFPRVVDNGNKKKRVRITFDDGGYLDLTPDHKVILRDGSTKEAANLSPGESLMPLYVSDINGHGYNWVYMLGKDSGYVSGWLQEHVFVANELIESPKKGEHVHHKDFNKKNNHPSNLVVMTEEDHMRYHTQINNKNKFGKPNLSHSSWMKNNGSRRKDVNFCSIVDACRITNSNKISDISSHVKADYNAIKLRLKENGFKNWVDFVSRFNEAQSISTDLIIKKESRTPTIEEIKQIAEDCASLDEMASRLSCSRNSISRRLESQGYRSWTEFKSGSHYTGKKRGPAYSGPDYQILCSNYKMGMTKLELAEACGTTHNKIMTCIKNQGYNSFSSWSSTFQNHKVVGVQPIEDDTVYNITVEKYHNLAVGSLSPKDQDKRKYSLIFATQCEMEYCLHGDTKIAIPGGYKTIAELAAECEGKPEYTFLVYSYDHNLQQIIPTFGKQARQTRVDHAYTVTFDNGKQITGTPNHRLMKRDGTFCKIEDLKPGDAMMPFYRRDLFNGCKEEGDGYRWIYTMNKSSTMNGWVAEHRVIGEMLKGSPLVEGEVVHHRNFVKHDNRPENLEVMTDEAHRKLHAEILNGVKWSEQNSDWIQRFKLNHSRFMSENNPAERKDITFGRILEIAERANFNSKKICEILDTDPNVVKRRLRKHGYKDFETFARAYNPDWRNHGWDNDGEKNPRYDRSITFDLVCSKFSKGMQLKDLADSLGVSGYVVEGRIKERGYTNFNEFSSTYDNLKVESIEYHGVIPLYDLTVDGYKNFATDTVISHNTPELAAALDIYADETCAQDEKGRVLHIYSDNEKIREILEDLFYNTLNVEFNLRAWARNLVKYGDMFLYNDVSPEHGVINAFPIPVNEIEREENYDPNDPMAVRYRWVTLGNRTLENWEVTHFRLLGNDMFLPYGSSVIEPARRIWRQLILIEDAMLVYRVVRAPERRVFYIDVANIPPENVPMYVEEQRKNLRSSQVIDRNTGRVDLRYNPLPVHKDTPIPLLDGTTLTIENLSKKMGEDTNWIPWVYSVQDGTNRVVPGKVVWCGKNYTAKTLTKVWLDDGSYITTAPEHPFVMRDGGRKRADELKVGDSLMPLYRKLSSKQDGYDIEGYETVYDPASDSYKLTHRLVANSVLSESREQVRKSIDWDSNNNLTVHHIDINRKNNSPENLRWMGNVDHIKLHSETGRARLIAWNRSDKKKRRVSEINKIRNSVSAMSGYNGSELHASHNESRRIAQKKSWKEDSESRKIAMRWNITDQMFESLCKIVSENPKFGKAKIHERLMQDQVFVQGLSNQSLNRDVKKFSTSAWESELVRRGYAKLPGLRKSICGYKNHKITSIETLQVEGEDVYCMTVVGPNGEDDRHNFAANGIKLGLDEHSTSVQKDGIFLWNSVDEDYFIPVRGGDSGTKIDTLAGGQNAAAVEDVAYIQKKLFAALKIPRAYLGYDEALSSKATLAQEDIRFSRTINVIQKTLVSELNKLAIIHLYANGFDSEDLQNFTLRLSNPSTVAQQQKLELWRSKFEIAGSAPEGQMSKEFIRKEIWGLNDEQIAAIDEQRLKEKIVDQTIESAKPEEEGGEEAEGEGGGDLFGGGEEEEGGEDLFAGDDVRQKGSDIELMVAGDDPDDDENFPAKISLKDVEVPVKAQKQLKQALYNRSRIKHNGPAKTHMPDFGKMVSSKNKSHTDPYDVEWMSKYVSDPLGESASKQPRHKTPVSVDVLSCLQKMSASSRFKDFSSRGGGSQRVLVENEDLENSSKENGYLDFEVSEKRNDDQE